MLELPEAYTMAGQINEAMLGKRIVRVIVGFSPHKFAWFNGDPQNYPAWLTGKSITGARSYGGMVEVQVDDRFLVFNDGVGLRHVGPDKTRPGKHQLLLEFEDGSALSAAVQMYGGLWCFEEGEFDNPYYLTAKAKPSPLSRDFDWDYFAHLLSSPEIPKLSAKAFLATEQRIPGLGNGVLQDILWNAHIHPKAKMWMLSEGNIEFLFSQIKDVLAEMTALGGRDTEKDLFGNPGGYKTIMSKNNAGLPCRICGELIKKQNYLGGSIYYCENCQAR